MQFFAIGRKLPFKFGTNASALYCRHFGVDLNEIASTGLFGVWKDEELIKPPDPYAILVMAYYAHITAVRMKGEKEDLTLEAFIEACNEEEGLLNVFQQAMLSSKLLGFRLDGKKEEIKKKEDVS